MNWSSGYISEIGYTHGYYGEMSPSLMEFALLLKGWDAPARSGLHYLELGFGQGLSANIHAAAAPGEYWGTDVNPMHASHAQLLARASGIAAQFRDDSFHDLAERDDLPEFDYITLHGIWSWVGDDVRRDIGRIIRRRLKVGGVVYVSYNTLPGWAHAMPLRQILAIHAETAGSDEHGVLGRVEAALGFAKRLADAEARYFTANPTAISRLEAIAAQDRRYVTHEYFNRHWRPTYFAEVDDWLNASKLSFAASAALRDNVDGINFNEAQRRLIASIEHPILRETVRDYLQNQQFRRDLFIRGGRRLSALEQRERLNAARVVLTTSPDEVPLELNTNLGSLRLKDEIYRPILSALAEDDYGPKAIGDLATRPEIAALPPGAIVEAITVLVGGRHVLPAQDLETVAAAGPPCDNLASHILDRARSSEELAYLPSPILGAGIHVARLEQLFLLARREGAQTPVEWAERTWTLLRDQGHHVLQGGKALETEEENRKELISRAEVFSKSRLPILTALKCTGTR